MIQIALNRGATVLAVLVAIGILMPRTGRADTAKANFAHYCAQCHGVKGDGKGINATEDLPVAPRDLTDGSDLGSFTDDQIFNTLTKGGAVNELSPIMPPWGNVLSEGEIRDLVQFVRGMCGCTYDPSLKRKKSASPGAGE